eukprot:4086339-Amphidinium_carterae.1
MSVGMCQASIGSAPALGIVSATLEAHVGDLFDAVSLRAERDHEIELARSTGSDGSEVTFSGTVKCTKRHQYESDMMLVATQCINHSAQSVVRINGQSTVQSMLLSCCLNITLGVIPLTAVTAVGVSQKVMSEISQINESVIRTVIKISTMRNQRKVRSESQKTKIQKMRVRRK